jgi:hypothetical protein
MSDQQNSRKSWSLTGKNTGEEIGDRHPAKAWI